MESKQSKKSFAFFLKISYNNIINIKLLYMKFKIDSEKLKKIISLSCHLCGTNLTLPILNNVLLNLEKDQLLISSTNLEVGLSISYPVKTEEEGRVAIPGKILSDFIASLPKGEIKLEEKDFILNIKSRGLQAKILGQDPKEFPILPDIKEKPTVEVESQEFISGLSKVNHIVSPSDTRVEISGVFLKIEKDRLFLVGTDSIRLGEKILTLPKEVEKKAVIIPQRTTAELSYIFSDLGGQIKIAIDPSQIGFDFTPQDPLAPQITLISRLIEGQYPEYKEIIPQRTKTQSFLDKEEFQRKIKIASLFSSRIQDIKLKFGPGKPLLISAASSEIGEINSKIEGKVEGESLEIVFNWKYLLDGLLVIDASEIFFGVNDSSSPAILRPIGDKTYLYVLMPKTI